MSGAALGGVLLDHFSIATTFIGGAALLLLASLAVGSGRRLHPQPAP
jgi:predicted MFS family arabinose efflux permease